MAYGTRWSRDAITFPGTSRSMDMVTRHSVREPDTRTLMVEVQTLPQQRRAGADQPVKNCFLLYIFSFYSFLVSNFALNKVC